MRADFGPAGLLRMSESALPPDRQRIDYGQEQNVQKLHATIQPDKADGQVTIKPFPLWTLVVCGFVFFFAGFFSARQDVDFTAADLNQGNPPPASSTLQVAQSTVANANAPAIVYVAMKNMKFSPATIDIKKGDTIEWKNDDITPHTATSSTFDSGSIDPDRSWRHTFTETGNFSYSCTFHPDMKAAVIVK